MRTRIKVVSFFLATAAVVAVGVISWKASSVGGCLISVPKVAGDGVAIKALEDVNEYKFPLTYENLYNKNIKALQSNHQVVMIGTNYTYPYVMNYGILKGGFFTKEAQDNKNRVAAMNKKAAFDVFGDLAAAGSEIKIDGVSYEVVGVIDDGDEESLNIFVPAGIFSDTAGALAVKTEATGILSEEYVKNEFKHIGVDEGKYDFLDLRRVLEILAARIMLSLEIMGAGILLLVIKVMVKRVGVKWREIKASPLYFTQLIGAVGSPAQKLAVLVGAVVGVAALVLRMALDIFEGFLEWKGIHGMFEGVAYTGFVLELRQVEELYVLSGVAFAVFILFFGIFVMVEGQKRKTLGPCPKPRKGRTP